MNMNQSKFFGYFEGSSSEPTYDPKHSVPCIVCCKSWTSDDVTTISILKEGTDRTYFYRAHKSCYNSLSYEEQVNYDSSIIDNI